MSSSRTEMIEQGKALALMGITSPDAILAVGEELRGIVTSFEALTDRAPTCAEIVWVFSERRGMDMRIKSEQDKG